MSQDTSDLQESDEPINHRDPEVLSRLYYDKGLTTQEIADLATVGRSAIQYQMDKHNLERRSRGPRPGEKYTNYATLCMDGMGYMTWHSRDPDRVRTMKVHRLVAIAQYGTDAVAGNHVHHRNGLSWDNRPENLEVMSTERHHTHHSRGERHPNAKLSEEDAKDILNKLDAGASGQELADEYSVSQATISMIKHGENWSHLHGND